MRAAVLADYAGAKDSFDPSQITVKSIPVPEPEDGEVRIKVMASSVNPVDWKMASGAMKQMSPLTFPFTLGFDCSGVVSAVGPNVERLKVGDEVWSDVAARSGGRPGKLKLGSYAEYVVVAESQVTLKPANLGFEEAAVVPLVGLTAVQAIRKLELVEGSSILVCGASGGVGIATVQIAKAKGIKVYATCSARNLDFVKGLAPDEIIDYTSSDWGEVLKGKNIDGVFDTVGEKDALVRACGILKEGGSFTTIVMGGPPPDPVPNGVKASFILTSSNSVADLDELKGFAEAGKLSIKIHETFPLGQVNDALKMSMGGKVVGKVCIKVGGTAPHARLVFSRHGESEWNVANKFTGWVDVDLSEKGVGEAKGAGELIKEEGIVFDQCYTSYLKRAIKTCNLALESADQSNAPVEKTWRLNERMYGGLTGLDKKETVVKHGAEQVQIWRRSFDLPPPDIEDDSPYNPKLEAKYKDLDPADIPKTESLKTVITRVMPFWENEIQPALKEGKTVFVAAHGNSIRAILKYIEGIPDDVIPGLEIPTGTPLVYDLDADLKPIPTDQAVAPLKYGRYLGDAEKIKAAAEAVKNQTKVAAAKSFTVYYHTACKGFTGRAFSPLCILEAAGAQYECKTPDEVPAGSNVFAPPIVTLPDGNAISQAGAICIALGHELGLAPTGPVAKAKAAQLTMDVSDMMSDVSNKKGAERVMKWVKHFEAALGDKPFLMGDKPTFVDYSALGAFWIFPAKAAKDAEDFKGVELTANLQAWLTKMLDDAAVKKVQAMAPTLPDSMM